MIILCSLYNTQLSKHFFPRHSRILFVSATNDKMYKKDYRVFKKANKSHKVEWLDWKKVPKSLLPYDVVFLAGGNTYLLADNLKKHDFGNKLREFLFYHKILVGESAGAICLTPSLKLAAIPTHSADELPKKVCWKGLNIVEFEVSPHYVEETDACELAEYARTSKRTITTLTDDQYIELTGGLWKI